jgi:CheY-like chemotaxis protein/HPt (histidine-containing phosphotransfer) domain-containing protein
MGGEISVESEYGRGSTFTVILPQKVRSYEKLAALRTPEEMKVLVYEPRKLYADSIVYAIDNLGGQCTAVADGYELHDKLSTDTFSFIFIASSLYEESKDIISLFGANAQIALLIEFGGLLPARGTSIISLPVYCISVANILNDVPVSSSHSEDDKSSTCFIAPDAKALIVDDINTNLKVASGLMLPYEIQIDICKSGAEAIAAVQAKQYDIVFMDHKMPGMDGVEAVGHIRAIEGRGAYYQDIPIIALTANAISGMREFFLENGFDDYLSKPIDTAKLNTILENWIPKEKQKSVVSISNETISTEEREPAAINIEGVDVDRGISISGGTLDFYLETLTTFYDDGRERISVIGDCLAAGNISLYTTYVHALKSAASSIGAAELSKAAEALEKAANREDHNFINSHNATFLATLGELLDRIDAALSDYKESRRGVEGYVDAEALKSDLLTMQDALESMDAGAINQTLVVLQKVTHPEEAVVAIKNMANRILVAEYDEAAEFIDAFLTDWDGSGDIDQAV